VRIGLRGRSWPVARSADAPSRDSRLRIMEEGAGPVKVA